MKSRKVLKGIVRTNNFGAFLRRIFSMIDRYFIDFSTGGTRQQICFMMRH